MTDVEAVSVVLAAVVDARRPLGDLWAALPAQSAAKTDAQLHPASGHGATSYLVVHTSATRPDGRVVTWSVSLRAGDELRIEGEVEIDDDDGGTVSLFRRVDVGSDASHAALLIREFATDIAAQRQWFDDQ